MYDEDAPDCPESVRFWCFTSGRVTDREKVSVTGQSSIRVRGNADVVAAMAEQTMTGAGSAPAPASQLSLSALVDVAKAAGGDAENKDKKEKKTNGKKAKKVKKEEPSNTKEKKDAGRNFHVIFGRFLVFTF